MPKSLNFPDGETLREFLKEKLNIDGYDFDIINGIIYNIANCNYDTYEYDDIERLSKLPIYRDIE